MDSRPAPMSEQPPAYARAVTRVYRRDLRPIVLLFTGISAIWLVFVGIQSFRYTSETGETSSMRLLDIICGALALALVAIEVWGFTAAMTQRLKLVKSFAFLSTIGAVVAIALAVVEIVEHFVTEQDQINQCVQDNEVNQSILNPGVLVGGDSTDGLVADCQSSWSRYTWYVFVWLVVSLLWGGVTAATGVAYYHQLSNPANNRMAPSSAYQMGPYGENDPPFRPPQYFASEGDAPPTYMGDAKMAPSDEKGAYEQPGGYDIEHNGDLSQHHENYSEVTLTGREGEGRV